jgi:hypothetical protein
MDHSGPPRSPILRLSPLSSLSTSELAWGARAVQHVQLFYILLEDEVKEKMWAYFGANVEWKLVDPLPHTALFCFYTTEPQPLRDSVLMITKQDGSCWVMDGTPERRNSLVGIVILGFFLLPSFQNAWQRLPQRLSPTETGLGLKRG